MSVTIAPGSTFAGYRIEALIGRGGMGVVYRATDLSLERPVALKLIAPELAQDERFRRRFLEEPRHAASLDHPNVVPIYEAGQHGGQLFLAMRYVAGTGLKDVLARDGTLAPERTLRILGQIAAALDAAHRRGLVHRDVKPANVLLDENEHAYLTDFGITKRLGADATGTGPMVGTLDYLAPEQIRGEDVDGRTDGYALACVLHECVSGAPPFRRATEPETMWAHMHDQPPSLPGRPRLDPVLRKALAKEKGERYGTCSDLISAARGALGLGTDAPPRSRRHAPAPMRRRGVVIGAGLLMLGAAITAAALTLTSRGGGSDLAPVGDGVAVLDPGNARVDSVIESATAPSNITVGEGAVWALNTADKTISRIDAESRAVTGRMRMRSVPTDLAAGAGALWVGNGGGRDANYTVSVSRVDPGTGGVTRTVKLSDKTRGASARTFNWGFADIAVGAGAVWAKNPDGTISRIDQRTGKLVDTIDVEAGAIAAGREGVWFADGSTVARIDPRTNRVGQRISIGSPGTSAIAVGGGSVWVTTEQQGAVWRIEPGRNPELRTIDVGAGVTYLAFGEGAAWAANYVESTVSRIDARTNSVTKVPLGAAQSLAAGAGSVWVSVAGGPRDGTLPAAVCGELVSGGTEPDVLIASDLPLQGPDAADPRAMADAIGLAVRRRGFRAGKYTVGYRSCDESTAQTGAFENRRCAANANAYAQAKRLVALIGPWSSYCAQIEIPIVNRARGGPLAMISPTNTYAGLTRGGGSGAVDGGYRGEPGVYYPTGVRNYARLQPGDDLQGVALAELAKSLRLGSVYVVTDGSPRWTSLVADPFRRGARRLGVGIAGSATFTPGDGSERALAAKVARSGAEGIVIGADPFDGGDRVLRALRDRLGSRVTIMGGFLFAFAADLLEQAGPAARGVYATTLDLPRTALPQTIAGRSFARDAGVLDAPAYGVLEAGQAAELVLDAIARSDGTRASVLEQLRGVTVRNGILGDFRLDRNGDISPASIPIVRITGATPRDAGFPPQFQGAVLDRVVTLPSRAGG